MKTIKLLICGEGIDAHAFAGIASSRKGIEVRVLSLNQDEAERWSSALRPQALKLRYSAADISQCLSNPNQH